VRRGEHGKDLGVIKKNPVAQQREREKEEEEEEEETPYFYSICCHLF